MSCPFFEGCLGESERNWGFSKHTKKETMSCPGAGVYSAALTPESAGGHLLWAGGPVMTFPNTGEQAGF